MRSGVETDEVPKREPGTLWAPYLLAAFSLLVGFYPWMMGSPASLLLLLGIPASVAWATTELVRRSEGDRRRQTILKGLRIGAVIGSVGAVLARPLPFFAAGWGLPWVLVLSPYYLGCPTALLNLGAEMLLLPRAPSFGVVVLFDVLFALAFLANWSVFGLAVGWAFSGTGGGDVARGRHIPARRLAAALGVLLVPALAFAVGMWAGREHRDFTGWFHRRYHLCRMIASNESTTIMHIRRIADAQLKYRQSTGAGVYAKPFRRLHEEDGRVHGLVAPDLARASEEPLAGYFIYDVPLGSDMNPVNPREEFAHCAVPAVYLGTGRNTFVVTSALVVWQKDLGGRPLVCLPGDPAAEGWIPVGSE